jgi:hypothetical protein
MFALLCHVTSILVIESRVFMKPLSSQSRALLLGFSFSLTLAACGGKTDLQATAKPAEDAQLAQQNPAKLPPVVHCAP